jgi:DNA-binding protein H-NS
MPLISTDLKMAGKLDFDAMPIDTLLGYYEQIRNVLTAKMQEQKKALDRQLKVLGQKEIASPGRRPAPALALKKLKEVEPPVRAPYPKVYPIYRNPDNSSETWSGRGLRPKWLTALLAAGKTIEELRIPSARPTSASKRLRSKSKQSGHRSRLRSK